MVALSVYCFITSCTSCSDNWSIDGVLVLSIQGFMQNQIMASDTWIGGHKDVNC